MSKDNEKAKLGVFLEKAGCSGLQERLSSMGITSLELLKSMSEDQVDGLNLKLVQRANDPDHKDAGDTEANEALTDELEVRSGEPVSLQASIDLVA
eukprot:CAMPEP_0181347680 /NCGR_PEP_ID=MMETSP1101-20121128/34006_1 /TAXON_ID=46948 /ORGANISM="Rhodomonas abbreviata, Strain Caron Lab Isolate" /LENGTH=95 /DNA_ID=CAMNT_0023459907 /DNA_START=179 /DNA_END=462 /DNA_ORIENTATION=-